MNPLAKEIFRTSNKSISQLCVVALLTCALCGCASAPAGTSPANPIPDSKTLYILTGTFPIQVIGLPSNATGTTAPSSVLTLPANFSTLAMTTDAAGQIYVAGISGTFGVGTTATEILVYPEGATGTASPVRTIITPQPTTDLAGSIAVDATGQIYVSDDLQGQVNVFAADANGASTPLRTIQWDANVFRAGEDITVDATGALYVLGYIEGTAAGLPNPTEVHVYAPGATGNAAPVRTLVGPNVGFGTNNASMAVDGQGNLFAIVTNPAAPFLNATEIAEYAPDADGDPVPVKTIVGDFGETGVAPTHLEIDTADNVYVFGQYVNRDLPEQPTLYPPLIATFPASASGTVTPTNQFTSTAIDDGALSFAAN